MEQLSENPILDNYNTSYANFLINQNQAQTAINNGNYNSAAFYQNRAKIYFDQANYWLSLLVQSEEFEFGRKSKPRRGSSARRA